MRRAAILVVPLALACGCSWPSSERETSALSALRGSLLATDDTARPIILRRRADGLGAEGHDFLIEALADPELHGRIVTAERGVHPGSVEDSFHVCLVNGLKFRFVDIINGQRQELDDLNARLDRRLLDDDIYLHRFILAWEPGNGIYREQAVNELTAADSTPASRRIAHRYLADYEGLRLDYDPTGPVTSIPARAQDALAGYKEEHYKGSWWQVYDRQAHVQAEEFLNRIEVATGRERENLLASFAHWTPKSLDTLPGELRYSCAVRIDGHEEAWARLLDSDDVELRAIAARTLWEHHSRRHTVKVIEAVSASVPGAGALAEAQSLVENGLRPESILAELTEGDFKWGAWLAGLRPHPTLVPAIIARVERRPAEPDQTAQGTERRLPFGMTRRSLTEFLDTEEKAAAVLALGKSGDGRAIAPLTELLISDDYRLPGDAARALSELADSRDLVTAITVAAEAHLIDLLAGKGQWVQRRACMALAKVGTARAIPALEGLAGEPIGICNAPGAARDAIRQIVARGGRPGVPTPIP